MGDINLTACGCNIRIRKYAGDYAHGVAVVEEGGGGDEHKQDASVSHDYTYVQKTAVHFFAYLPPLLFLIWYLFSLCCFLNFVGGCLDHKSGCSLLLSQMGRNVRI